MLALGRDQQRVAGRGLHATVAYDEIDAALDDVQHLATRRGVVLARENRVKNTLAHGIDGRQFVRKPPFQRKSR